MTFTPLHEAAAEMVRPAVDRSWAEPPPPTDRRLRRLVLGLGLALLSITAFTVGANVQKSRSSSSSGFPAGFPFPGGAGGFSIPGLTDGGVTGTTGATGSTGSNSAGVAAPTTTDPGLGGLLDGIGAANPPDTASSHTATQAATPTSTGPAPTSPAPTTTP